MTDPRLRPLNWIPQHDERSRAYGIADVADVVPAEAELVPKLWTEGPVLDQGTEGACFPPGTFVRLADGSEKKIEDLRLLDSVITAEGRVGTVHQLMVRTADRGLVRVDVEGHIPLRCTPEHPILTARGYVAAEDLTSEDLVAVTRYDNLNSTSSIETAGLVDLTEFKGTTDGTVNTGGVITQVTSVPPALTKSAGLGRLLGLYAAEGHTTANKVVWSFGGHEEHTLVAETVRLIASELGSETRIQRRPNGSINVVLYGKAWRYLFAALVPGTSKHGDKHLSPYLTNGPVEFLEGLLNGWMDGDGHARRTEVVGVSVCRELALNMHSIANDLGYAPAIRRTEPKPSSGVKTRQPRYDVRLGLVGGARSATMTPTAMWRRVTAVVDEPFEGHVYNIEVGGDHSYVADGVGVHNCVGFGWTGTLLAEPYAPLVQPLAAAANLTALSYYQRAKLVDEFPGEDYSGTSVLAGAKVLAEEGKISEYRWCFSIEEVRYAVMNHGPVVLGIPWYESMYYTDADARVRISGPKVGGHCIILTGYQPLVSIGPESIQAFRWRNSWGESYGRGGSAWISYDDLAMLLSQDGEACVPTKVQPPLF